MDDLAKGALVLIGVGLVSKRFGAGIGLGELGVGVQQLVGAPGVGVGLGLTGTARGIRDIAESFGDIGRGISAIFKAIPDVSPFPGNGYEEPQYEAAPAVTPPLITVSGGSKATLATGGGENVPKTYTLAPGAVTARAAIVRAGGRVERTEKNSGGSTTMRSSLV